MSTDPISLRSCVVLGSGRSGTSMVAGAMRDAGYFMGDHLYGGNVANPKGFFEDREVNAINEELIASVIRRRPRGPMGVAFRSRPARGQRWLAMVPQGARIHVAPSTEARIRAIVDRSPFCLKDPRFCYTLAAWEPFLPPDAIRVCVFREPARTANSILAECRRAPYLRGLRMDFTRALRVWTLMYRHVLDELRATGTWEFVHFDQFLDGSAVPVLEAATGARLDRSFADPGLKRSEDGPVSGETARVYAELCELAGWAPAGESVRTDARV